MTPLVTIITVCRNPGISIRETFTSVINQTYSNVEYIVVDGLSSDGTLEWLNQTEQVERITVLISERDFGIYDAINKGISHAKGTVVGILHAGDVFDNPNTLQDIFSAVIIDPNSVDVITGGIRLRYADTSLGRDLYPSSTAVEELKYRMSLCHPATFVTLRAYQNYGVYDPAYRISGDYELFRRFLLAGAKFSLTNKCLVIMQYGGISTQYKNIITIAKEYSNIIYGKRNSLKKALFFLVNAARLFGSLTKARLM